MSDEKYEALVPMFYISTDTGEEKFVNPGDEFSDMDEHYAQQEIDHGTLALAGTDTGLQKEVIDDGEPDSDTR